MTIVAYNEADLDHIADLLHDLLFPLPRRDGYEVVNDAVRITFTDQERILRNDSVSEFELAIHDVDRMRVHGGFIGGCPDPIQFNKFKYNAKHNELTLVSVHPIKVSFAVRRLHVTLDQLK